MEPELPADVTSIYVVSNTSSKDIILKQMAHTSDITLPVQLIMGTLMICMILLGFFGNLIVCLIVYQRAVMRSAINLLLANMAFSDILTSLMPMVFSFVTIIWGNSVLGEVQCKIILFVREILICIGIFMLMSISVNRYLIIVQRKDKLTITHARILIAASWVTSLVLALPPVVGLGDYTLFKQGHSQLCIIHFENDYDVIFLIVKVSVTFFIPILVMTFSFSRILNVVKKNNSRVHNHPNIDFSISVINNNGHIGLPILQRSFKVSFDMSFKTRAFKTILILFIAFVSCWTPYALNLVVSHFTEHESRTRALIFLWFGFAKCAINPIIYSMRIKKFRQHCRELIPNFITRSTSLSNVSKRRINPSSAYEFQENSNI